MILTEAGLEIVGPGFGQTFIGRNEITVSALSGTDAFVPPDGTASVDRLPGARLRLPSFPCSLAAYVRPKLTTKFDAGALMLRTDGNAWAKLAFELSPQGRRTAVSVVTMTYSDDANGPSFVSEGIYLRVYRSRGLTAFHVSEDAKQWDLVRLFLMEGENATIEFVAQSPIGSGSQATFSEIALSAGEIPNLRDGS